jgi:hypothetical protein
LADDRILRKRNGNGLRPISNRILQDNNLTILNKHYLEIEMPLQTLINNLDIYFRDQEMVKRNCEYYQKSIEVSFHQLSSILIEQINILLKPIGLTSLCAS